MQYKLNDQHNSRDANYQAQQIYGGENFVS
jgi:hypothetical protein